MVVHSGTRPYQYEGPWPFNVTSGNKIIGFSGILYEQIMYCLLAERSLAECLEGHTLLNPASGYFFRKYINKGANISEGIVPDPTGRNLDKFNSSGVPGGINFYDYITAMRTQADTITSQNVLNLYGYLIAYSADYYTTNWESVGGYNRNTATLESGIADIDLREVQIQPYCTFDLISPFLSTWSKNAPHPGQNIAYSGGRMYQDPIMPNFIDTNGNLVHVTQRDIDTMVGARPYYHNAYIAAASGKFFCVGDLIQSGNTRIRIWYNNLVIAGTGDCDSYGERYYWSTLSSGTEDIFYRHYKMNKYNYGFGTFTLPSSIFPRNSGCYDIDIFNTNAIINNIYTAPSSLYSILAGSGVYDINAHKDHLNGTNFNFYITDWMIFTTSGNTARLHNPINGENCWIRFFEEHVSGITSITPNMFITPTTGSWTNLTLGAGSDIYEYHPITLNFVTKSTVTDPNSFPGSFAFDTVGPRIYVTGHTPETNHLNLDDYILTNLASGLFVHLVNSSKEIDGYFQASGELAGVDSGGSPIPGGAGQMFIGLMNGKLWAVRPSGNQHVFHRVEFFNYSTNPNYVSGIFYSRETRQINKLSHLTYINTPTGTNKFSLNWAIDPRPTLLNDCLIIECTLTRSNNTSYPHIAFIKYGTTTIDMVDAFRWTHGDANTGSERTLTQGVPRFPAYVYSIN